MTKISMAILFFLIVGTSLLNAQGNDVRYPVEGEKMPPFELDNVDYYKRPSFTTEDLRGKWTIMDFWSKYCVVCVQSFSKLSEFQKEFGDNIQFLLVGRTDNKHYTNTESIYERYRKSKSLHLSVAYDSAIFEQFGIEGVPHIVVVNPEGVVYAVTGSEFINREKLEALIAGEYPRFRKLHNKYERKPKTRPWAYLVLNGEKPKDKLFQSILSAYNGEAGGGGFYEIDRGLSTGTYQAVRFSLSNLYNVAYLGIVSWANDSKFYGRCWPRPILEVADPSTFLPNYSTNENLYNYSLMVPMAKASRECLMAAMQLDLQTYFGYNVVVETRQMPYWRLRMTDAARKRLATKYSKTEYTFDPSVIDGRRIKLKSVVGHIRMYASSDSGPILDETNMDDFVDIKISAAFTDLQDVANALRKQGLILEQAKKEMKVVVIRDQREASEINNSK